MYSLYDPVRKAVPLQGADVGSRSKLPTQLVDRKFHEHQSGKQLDEMYDIKCILHILCMCMYIYIVYRITPVKILCISVVVIVMVIAFGGGYRFPGFC